MSVTLDVERSLLAGCRLVAGMDEVGRGALAGPVAVGAVVVDAHAAAFPAGLADSKELTPAARAALLEPLRAWGLARAVGYASADEVDNLGIIGALRAAGRRALASLAANGAEPEVVLLDGRHDWLSDPDAVGLFEENSWRVVTRVKADRDCASVAAASVLAKCARDALMAELDGVHPGYGWAANKGYGAARHLQAIAELGPSPQHRVSWNLPAPSGVKFAAGGGA